MAIAIETFHKGDQIIRQGTVGDRMFMVIRGRVRIYRTSEGEQTTLATIGAGEIFGEMSVLGNMPRSASVEAAEVTELRVISRAEFESMECDPVIRKILSNISHRMEALDKDYEKLAVGTQHQRSFLASIPVRRDWAEH